ncbi:MAG: dihydroorotase [Candidatus Aenigmatarchaeota archaeon]
MIDPHVHCRDGEESYKETIKHVFEIAKKQGIEKIFDMPNTKPPLLGKKELLNRLKLVPKERRKDYFVYIAATPNEKQLKEAIKCYKEFRNVVGLKLYATIDSSSSKKVEKNIYVPKERDQEFIYKILSENDYRGVLALHCEKAVFIKKDLWNPEKPISHAIARPKISEIEAIKDQIRFAKKYNFKGILHICHISTKEGVELVKKERKSIRITCGVTPHHILWSDRKLKEGNGLLYKTNPPLRSIKDVIALRRYLKNGLIDWIESDHAPHALIEKLFYPHLSGYPSLILYSIIVNDLLPSIGMNEKMIRKVTFENIYKIFRDRLE